ncbi:MAG: peptidase C14, partial [Coleofasciculaceae cyanobacterium SM2_3_26]|nr:peptidase C14 [Coleofasciculaceae cyanobacterium SM2_3_26]
MQPLQVSPLNQAVYLAAQVPPEDPLYEQAQQSIQRWSQMIWDIAQARANRGEYSSALSAALLVPKEAPELKAQADVAANEWRPLAAEQNQALLDSARSLVIEGDAPSYSRAIEILRLIPPDQPRYAESQAVVCRVEPNHFANCPR